LEKSSELILLGRVLMAGEDGEHGVVVAMGDRNAGVGGTGDGRTDAGHDFKGTAGFDQFLGFLTPASENEGVAAFEPGHAFAGKRLPHEQALMSSWGMVWLPASLPA
jgi:hypothetical protein